MALLSDNRVAVCGIVNGAMIAKCYNITTGRELDCVVLKRDVHGTVDQSIVEVKQAGRFSLAVSCL